MGLRRAKRKMLENEADETIRTSNITQYLEYWKTNVVLLLHPPSKRVAEIFSSFLAPPCLACVLHSLLLWLVVKDLLEKAGLGDNLEKVRDMYDGYETTLKNGLNIHLYSPWAVVKYLMTKQFSKYWSSGIPKRIEEALGNPKIATKIRKIMPGESVRIEYHGKLEIKHIDALNNMIWKNEINKCHEFFNHDLKLIKKFTNSGEALAKSCKNRRVDIKGYGRIKDKVRILAINIDTMFYNAKRRPRNEQEFQSALYIYLNLQFDYVACQCITRDDNDILH
ncbi:hypothetical protein PV326_010874 [Microctonus aethiopoides]|nr:hypothetical protein PV326_010874 [Microctonus aethiopoides]